jgi:hypothetical protein
MKEERVKKIVILGGIRRIGDRDRPWRPGPWSRTSSARKGSQRR